MYSNAPVGAINDALNYAISCKNMLMACIKRERPHEAERYIIPRIGASLRFEAWRDAKSDVVIIAIDLATPMWSGSDWKPSTIEFPKLHRPADAVEMIGQMRKAANAPLLSAFLVFPYCGERSEPFDIGRALLRDDNAAQSFVWQLEANADAICRALGITVRDRLSGPKEPKANSNEGRALKQLRGTRDGQYNPLTDFGGRASSIVARLRDYGFDVRSAQEDRKAENMSVNGKGWRLVR